MRAERTGYFREREHQFSERSVKFAKQVRLVSIVRVILFLAALIIVILAANAGNLVLLLLCLALFLTGFGLLVNYHDRLKYRLAHQRFLAGINRDELRRLSGDLETFDPGVDFLETEHPYHEDLDIFGRNSLFQLINRTHTYWGRTTLSQWISEPADRQSLIRRQEAVRELSSHDEWIQEFQASALHFQEKDKSDTLIQWLNSPNLMAGKNMLRLFGFLGPLILIGSIILHFLSLIPLSGILPGFIFNSLVLFYVLKDVREIHEYTSRSLKSIQSVEALVYHIERSSFNSGLLKEIQACFHADGRPASKIIGRLKSIFLQLENRNNMMYQLLNVFLMLDIHLGMAAESWKKKQPEGIRQWFGRLGEMESLNSLAAFSFANPDYVFPELADKSYHFKAVDIGHPLIPQELRVNNDFTLHDKGTIALITGSNMAGKSTFLRTVGINAVLAFAGAPVSARKMEVSPFRVFTSMRTRDNLEEHISSFYAELRRIRLLLDALEKGTPVMFFLDELLKGTNSRDRHLGAVSLINQLSEKHAFGLISTHDLELAYDTRMKKNVVNYSFESTIHEDEIDFDYRLTEGICETFNASKLMEKMGIILQDRKPE